MLPTRLSESVLRNQVLLWAGSALNQCNSSPVRESNSCLRNAHLLMKLSVATSFTQMTAAVEDSGHEFLNRVALFRRKGTDGMR